MRLPSPHLLWGFAAFNLNQVLVTLTNLCLARFLVPEDLGLVALATAVTLLAEQGRNLGLREALIREPAPPPRLVDTLFWHFVAAGALLGGAVWLTAPALAALLRVPELGSVLRLACWVVPLGGVAAVPSALLVRARRWRRLFFQELGPFLLYLAVAYLQAARGAHYWALIQAGVACAALRAVLYLAVFRPRPVFRPALLRARLPFGLNVCGQFLLSWCHEHLLRLLLARALGPAELGLFGLAVSLTLRPQALLAQPLVQMALPHFARVLAAGGDLAAAHRALLRRAVAASLALGFLEALATPPLLGPLLGPQWAPAAPFVRVLALAFAAASPGWLTPPLLQALGRPGVFSRFLLVKVAVELCALALALRRGLWSFVWTFAALEAVFALASLCLALRVARTAGSAEALSRREGAGPS